MAYRYCLTLNSDILNYVPLDKVQRVLQRYHPAGSVMLLDSTVYPLIDFKMPTVFVHDNKVYLRLHYWNEDITYNKDENSINACRALHKGTVADFTCTLPDGRVLDVSDIKKCSLGSMETAYFAHLKESGELYKVPPPPAIWQR